MEFALDEDGRRVRSGRGPLDGDRRTRALGVPRSPAKDLFLPLRVGAYCDDAFILRATGGLAWLALEGGMWEFAADGHLYDLSGVERFLPADLVAFLQDHPGTHLTASVEGIAEPCLATFHMHGIVVRVTALEV